ncbi:MAG: hypothetical protein C0412_05135 [Flavobacterium sp.]|nr:hypothetical protein [Flavobacterium sp.]
MKPGSKILILLFLFSGVLLCQDSLKNKAVNRLKEFKQYYFEGKYKEAALVYFDHGDNLTAEESYYMGLAHFSLFNYDLAIDYFKKANEKDKVNAGFEYQLAKTYLFLGKAELAEKHFANILAHDPNYLPVLFDSGTLDYSFKKYGDAVRKFKKVIKLTPANFLAFYNLAKVYSSMEPAPAYNDSVHTYLSAAVDLNPDYMPAVEMLGLRHINNNRYSQALRLFLSAIEKYPARGDYYYYAGTCHEKEKEFAKAIPFYKKAVEINPREANYWDHMGYSYFNLKNYDSSIVAYINAIRNEEEIPTYYQNLAFAYVQTDSISQAMAAFNTAVTKMHPQMIGQIYFQIGNVNYQKELFKEAKEAYQTALFYNPRDIESLYMGAIVDDNLKNYSLALSGYKKTMQLMKDTAEEGTKLEENERYTMIKKRITDLSKNIKIVKK